MKSSQNTINYFFICILFLFGMSIKTFAQKQSKIRQKEIADSSGELFEAMRQNNLSSFPYKSQHWSCHNLKELVKLHEQIRFNPQPRNKRIDAFEMFGESGIVQRQSCNNILFDYERTWNELFLFSGAQVGSAFVANTLDKTYTEWGKLAFYQMLTYPTNDIKELLKRHSIITTFLNESHLRDEFVNIFKTLATTDTTVVSFWNDWDPMKSEAERARIVPSKIHASINKYAEKINNSETLLLLNSVLDKANTLTYAGFEAFGGSVLTIYSLYLACSKKNNVPGFIDRQAQKYNTPPKSILGQIFSMIDNQRLQGGLALGAALYCFAKAGRSFKYLEGKLLAEQLMHKICVHIARALKNVDVLGRIIANNENFAGIKDFLWLKNYALERHISLGLLRLKKILSSPEFDSEKPNLLKSISIDEGKVIRAFLMIYEMKEELAQLFGEAGLFEAYFAASELIREPYMTENGNLLPFCLPEYKEGQHEPYLELQDFRHVLVDKQKVVPTSIKIGGGVLPKDSIFTGPNEAGKSTSLKAIALCIYLACCGLPVPASSMVVTPFSLFTTSFSVKGDVNKGHSDFKSQVVDAHNISHAVSNLNENEFACMFFDEMFNSTTYKEGSVCAYTICKHLGSCNNGMTFVATHFPLLTKLEQEENTFANYKVSVQVNDDGSIVYPYQIEKGIADQHVAIPILRSQGFVSHILDKAMDQMNR